MSNSNDKSERTKWQFRGVHLPAEMVISWMNGEISDGEMKLLVFVEATVEAGGDGCHASNGYIARSINMAMHYVPALIKSLKEKGFLKVTYVTKDGEESEEYSKKDRLENRYLETCWSRIGSGTPFKKNLKPPFKKNLKQKEIDTNVSISSKYKRKKERITGKDISTLKSTNGSDIDRKLAERLRDGLARKNKTTKANISKWSRCFTELRKHRTVKEIKAVMDFHIEHLHDRFEPRCWSAETFCCLDPDKKGFANIEDAMRRHEQDQDREQVKKRKQREDEGMGW